MTPLFAKGPNGGEELPLLALSHDGVAAKGKGLPFTAKFDKLNNRGDGSVHVGYIDKTGVDLGAVTLPGDLGRIAAGDTTLTVGVLGTSTSARLRSAYFTSHTSAT